MTCAFRLAFVATLLGFAPYGSVAASRWADDLYLGRGDLWRQRVPIVVTNDAANACTGTPVSVRVGASALPIAGVRVEELRLVDDRGVGLLFSVWAKKRIEHGAVPDGASLTLPVSLPPRAGATYWLYWDNPSAWGYADHWSAPVRPSACSARVGPAERLSVQTCGDDSPWAEAESDADFRVPLRVVNLSERPVDAALSSVSLDEALRGARTADVRLYDGARRLDLCRIGNRAFFVCDVPAGTVRTYWLYARAEPTRAKTTCDGPVRTALGSLIPSDQVLVARDDVPDLAAYRALVGSAANLLHNACFEQGLSHWRHSTGKGARDVLFDTVKTGGRIGDAFAKMTVPASAPHVWRGFYQDVPVEPGRHYFFGGFLSCDGAAGPTLIHAHVKGRDGKVALMTNTSSPAAPNSPWTPSFGIVRADVDASRFELHLTSAGCGTFAYDGLVVAAFVPVCPGKPENRRLPDSRETLAVASVEPIVKVFRETPVRDEKAFRLALARNETEPLQLAVRSPRALDDLSLSVETPAGLSADVGWVGFVPVDYPSAYYHAVKAKWELKHPTAAPGTDGWSGWWPDPIAPECHGSVKANETQPVWVNFKTTAETKPGDYDVRLVWKACGQTVRTDTCRVRVWNFVLPAVAETPAIYDLRLGRSHWDADLKGLSESERRELFWRFFSEKRICPDTLGGSVAFSRGADGRLTADFAEYDRLAERYFGTYRFPHSYMPREFYCFGWGMPPRPFMGEAPYEGKWPYENVNRAELRPAFRQAYQEALRLYWEHVNEKGWADRLVLYISDEPHFTVKAVERQMVALCEMIHEVSPAIRIYSSTWRHCPSWNGSLDVWGVGHYGCFPVEVMRELARAGKHVWFTTDGQLCLDTPYCAAERMFPHYCAAYQAEAYEFWGATWLTYNPWQYGWHSYIDQTDTPGKHYSVRYPDGDGYLIYPGIPGRFKGPVTSVRLEAARDGVEDFSYLKALERLAARTADPRAGQAASLLADFHALVSIPNAGGRYSTRALPEPKRVGELRFRAGELLNEPAAAK